MNDFSNYTLEDLNHLKRDFINSLTEEEFMNYYSRSKELGNNYLFDGLTTPEHDIGEKYKGYVPINFYGTSIKRLVNNRGEWQIWQGAVFPEFKIKPVAMSWEMFKIEMQKLGVTKEKLKEYRDYIPSFDNF